MCENEKLIINIKFGKEIDKDNCLSYMAINLAQLVINKYFPSINELECKALRPTK